MLKAISFNQANVKITGGTINGVLIDVNQIKATFGTLYDIDHYGGALTNVRLSRRLANAAVTAAAGTTFTATQFMGGFITRSGPTAAYTDTTDTATNIIGAISNAVTGTCFELTIINTVAFVGTIAAGAGVTLTGTTTLAASSTRTYLGTVTSATTVELRGISAGTL